MWAVSCLGHAPGRDEAVPRGRLPQNVRPEHYSLDLSIVPDRDRFSGTAVIRVAVDEPLETLWIHGRDLQIDRVTVQDTQGDPVSARWRVMDPTGVVALLLPRPVGPGAATLRIDYSAEFGRTLRGLYHVEANGKSYAFTQFEPIAARQAFPGFDEPSFKTPFEVSLTVRQDHTAIANTPLVEEELLANGLKRVRFAPTPPLPTYLLAWAVGPLDLVDAPDMPAHGPRKRALPFRGVAVEGRGGELAYALEHTPPLLEALESYFGSEYPFQKLDVMALPDFGAGAMENAGAITFRDSLLLLEDATAPEWQRRAFTYVMAHELAHQWFGDLVTLAWWNDLWLNEAFATWMGTRAVEMVAPEQRADLAQLEHVLGAMNADSLISARRIRQPIESAHDIRNAFDAITYSKGAGVLAMFERWIGTDRFRSGVRQYLQKHALGVAVSGDLLAALSDAAGRDVTTPFHTFLDQPGVPFVEAETHCQGGSAHLTLRQSRFLPVGSQGSRDSVWQIPVCARYGLGDQLHEACTLLVGVEGTLPLDAPSCPDCCPDCCPDWVIPNAEGAGYYRWSLAPRDAERLRSRGLPHLSTRERLSFADGLEAALRSNALPAGDVFAALAPLANDPARAVAEAPMSMVRKARDHLVEARVRPAVEAFVRGLYTPTYQRLGWEPRPVEDGETRLLRGSVIEFLAFVGRDPEIRQEAAARGRRFAGIGGGGVLDPKAVDTNLAGTALAVAVQDGGPEVFDALLAHLEATDDAVLRQRLLSALGTTLDPELAMRARNLALGPGLRVNETLVTLRAQMEDPATRGDTWRWVELNFDELVERIGSTRAGGLPQLASSFCSAERAQALEEFFAPRIDTLGGGPRNLAGALERIRLCAALVEAQGPRAAGFFSGGG